MARKRMIDPNFWRDEKIGALTHVERLMFIGLWTFADDNGVGRANPNLLKADILPYDVTLRASDFEKSLQNISELSLITLYTVGKQNYYFINNFSKYQSINRPTPSTLPLPDEKTLTEHSLNTHDKLTPNIKEDNIREDNINNICANDINDLFEKLWKLYPIKRGKGSISKTQKEKLFKIGYDKMKRAIDRYIAEQEKKETDIKFYKNGSTFFNSGYIDYLDENYTDVKVEERGRSYEELWGGLQT